VSLTQREENDRLVTELSQNKLTVQNLSAISERQEKRIVELEQREKDLIGGKDWVENFKFVQV